MFRVAIDTGGTFTDFVFQNLESGEKTFWKTLSTPSRPEQAVLHGLAHLSETLGAGLGRVREILLATTVTTNAIIERKGSPTGLIATEGFRDVLIIGREKRHDNYDLFLDKPAPLVKRRLIAEVAERIGHDGSVVREIDSQSVRQAIDALLQQGVESIAVSLLHAYANPVHEQVVGEHVRAQAPGVSISLSSEVSPKYREYERTSTTVANAYVKPIMQRYLGGLERVFAEMGFRGALYAMQSNGGLMTPDLAKKYPITMVESGPSAGVLMCTIVGRQEGFQEVLTFDMGGTTAKVGAMEGGEPAITPSIEVDGVNLRKWSGLPLNIPAIELIEIGAGGGSIAKAEMGLIHVGPESAGAEPGPICYGKGGERATLTDANLLLGYLDPAGIAGGAMALDAAAAERGIAGQVAEPLGLSVPQAAWGIHAVANASMEQAMRSMSMDRGRDPRHYAMVAFGGAGPLHAARLARALGVPQVIVPWGAGVGSALGLLDADAKFDVSQTSLLRIGPESTAAVAAIFHGLEQRARNEVREINEAREVIWRRFAYMRYRGQGYELKIDLPPGRFSEDYAARIIAAFHEAYREAYGYSQEENEIEVADWYLTAIIPRRLSADSAGRGGRAPAPTAALPAKTRRAFFPEFGDFTDCPVFDRYALYPAHTIVGPAIVEEREATTLILPGDTATVSPAGHLTIAMGDAP
jgi:N-methylhydantoinase A